MIEYLLYILFFLGLYFVAGVIMMYYFTWYDERHIVDCSTGKPLELLSKTAKLRLIVFGGIVWGGVVLPPLFIQLIDFIAAKLKKVKNKLF